MAKYNDKNPKNVATAAFSVEIFLGVKSQNELSQMA